MITGGLSWCCGNHIFHNSIFSIIPSVSFTFCYLGGWLLITQYIEGNPSVLVQLNSYRQTLSNYTINEHYLLRSGFNQLKEDMGFSQIRFYCFKKSTGRVFHIMTSNDSMGNDVVKFFTTSNNLPQACGSFWCLPDDNSSLAVNCHQWGYPKNKWGHKTQGLTTDRLYRKPLVWSNTRYFRFTLGGGVSCDDKPSSGIVTHGDKWQIFVR